MIRRKTPPAIVPGIDLPPAPTPPDRPGLVRLEGTTKSALETGRNRLAFAGGVFLLLFLTVAVRLVDVAFHPNATEVARAIPQPELPMKTVRGDVTDRNGILLATNLPTVRNNFV